MDPLLHEGFQGKDNFSAVHLPLLSVSSCSEMFLFHRHSSFLIGFAFLLQMWLNLLVKFCLFIGAQLKGAGSLI